MWRVRIMGTKSSQNSKNDILGVRSYPTVRFLMVSLKSKIFFISHALCGTTLWAAHAAIRTPKYYMLSGHISMISSSGLRGPSAVINIFKIIIQIISKQSFFFVKL